MDHDALALSGIVLSVVALLATANIAWLLMLFLSCAYGGWLFAKRVAPAEEYGV